MADFYTKSGRLVWISTNLCVLLITMLVATPQA